MAKKKTTSTRAAATESKLAGVTPAKEPARRTAAANASAKATQSATAPSQKTFLDNKMNQALGLVETKGLLALIEATDAMAKAANVEIVKRIDIGGAFCTTVVTGDVGSVRAAVEAGAAAASQVGELVGSHVIARPSDGLADAFIN